MRNVFAAALAVTLFLARPAVAQVPTPERLASLADPCPAADAAHAKELERVLAVEVPDSVLGATARGLAKVLSSCGDARVLHWFEDRIRLEAPLRRQVASAFLSLLEPISLGDSLNADQAAFLTDLVRSGYAKGRDDTEPPAGRDLQSYILEGLKNVGSDVELTRLYFELVGTGQLDPVFGEGRLLGHLVARRGDAFLGEYADVIAERPQLLRDTDFLFYVNQILYGRARAPGSGAEKLAQTLTQLGVPPIARD